MTLSLLTLQGGTTLRAADNPGTPILAPITLLSLSHANGSTHSANLPLQWTLQAEGLNMSNASLGLIFDGANVSDSVILTPTSRAGRYRLEYAVVLPTNTSHSYVLTVTHSNATPEELSVSASFSTDFRSNGDFVIELEDFDYGGGKFLPEASDPSYRGLGYNGRGGQTNVDYFVDVSPDDEPNHYRSGEDINVPLAKTPGDLERSGYLMDGNYRITWGGGDWFHYTRVLPLGRYQIYAAMSYGGQSSTGILARLSLSRGMGKVSKSPQVLGYFFGPETAGWGVNRYEPLRDSVGGSPVSVVLDGQVTLRFDLGSGDADHLILVPDLNPSTEVVSRWIEGENLRMHWKLPAGDWALQSANSPLGDFQPVPNVTLTNNPITLLIPRADAAAFYRWSQVQRSDYGD